MDIFLQRRTDAILLGFQVDEVESFGLKRGLQAMLST